MHKSFIFCDISLIKIVQIDSSAERSLTYWTTKKTTCCLRPKRWWMAGRYTMTRLSKILISYHPDEHFRGAKLIVSTRHSPPNYFPQQGRRHRQPARGHELGMPVKYLFSYSFDLLISTLTYFTSSKISLKFLFLTNKKLLMASSQLSWDNSY